MGEPEVDVVEAGTGRCLDVKRTVQHCGASLPADSLWHFILTTSHCTTDSQLLHLKPLGKADWTLPNREWTLLRGRRRHLTIVLRETMWEDWLLWWEWIMTNCMKIKSVSGEKNKLSIDYLFKTNIMQKQYSVPFICVLQMDEERLKNGHVKTKYNCLRYIIHKLHNTNTIIWPQEKKKKTRKKKNRIWVIYLQ